MGLSREQAVREALRYTTWPHAYCAAFVQKVFGFGWVGASAIDAWNRAQHKHTDFPPPPGVPCYWGPKGHNPYGHIAVSLGGGKCRSSDYPGSGRVGTVDIRWIEQHWPNTGAYLGWSEDIAGHIIPGADAPTDEEDDMTPEQMLAARIKHRNIDAPLVVVLADMLTVVQDISTRLARVEAKIGH